MASLIHVCVLSIVQCCHNLLANGEITVPAYICLYIFLCAYFKLS